MNKVHDYMCVHTALIKSTAGIKTKFFQVRSLLLPARVSLWRERSGTST